ncbi:MAG TPA: hypothetical protein VD913_03835 [bacterium]|nr:hypothetical protein [bacterium]
MDICAVVILWIAVSIIGCSKQYWSANVYMLKAENAVSRARQMRARKTSYESRLPHYREACSYFLKAFELDEMLFTLNRIEEAQDACWRAEDADAREIFIEFEERYARKRPREYEYGDAGVSGVADNL